MNDIIVLNKNTKQNESWNKWDYNENNNKR